MKRDHYFLRIILGLLFFSFIIILLPSCATEKKKVKKDPFFDKWKVKAEKSKGHSPTAKRRIIDLPESKEIGPVQKPAVQIKKPLPTKNISLKMYNVEKAVLIRTLARAADIDIVINESVKGKTNIHIKNQPWDQIFNAILETHGLTYSWMGNIIRIMTLEDRELELKRTELELKGRELELKREAQQKNFKMFESLIVTVVEIDYADINNLKENLIDFLTKDDAGKVRGSIKVDSHTNSLVIHAVRSDIERMISLIEALDKPTRQILIEAHIVEATKSTARELGIQWGGLYKVTSGSANHYITPGARSSNVLDQQLRTDTTSGGITTSTPVTINPTSDMVVDFPATIGATGLTLGYVAEKVGRGILAVQLSALESDGKVNIISSPSITTVDNQKAIIESGKKVPYQSVEDGDVSIKYQKVALSLEVTPHVIDGETLSMTIKTTKDELDWANAVGGQPAISTKKAETKVILRDGETTVIGGLNKENVDDSESGVPLLKDIPFLGYFFKGTRKSNDLEDVLIFITPHILEEFSAAETQ